jgi:hypothetical protein
VIVGDYNLTSSGPKIGFKYDGTTYSTLMFPGSTATVADGIQGSNIVGNYTLGGVTHGFLFDGTNWQTIDYPGASLTSVADIDGNTIVGYYTLAGVNHGFEATVPEPASVLLALGGFGAIGLMAAKRRKI